MWVVHLQKPLVTKIFKIEILIAYYSWRTWNTHFNTVLLRKNSLYILVLKNVENQVQNQTRPCSTPFQMQNCLLIDPKTFKILYLLAYKMVAFMNSFEKLASSNKKQPHCLFANFNKIMLRNLDNARVWRKKTLSKHNAA